MPAMPPMPMSRMVSVGTSRSGGTSAVMPRRGASVARAMPDQASAVLHGVPEDQVRRLAAQAAQLQEKAQHVGGECRDRVEEGERGNGTIKQGLPVIQRIQIRAGLGQLSYPLEVAGGCRVQ
mgnify:CR=1 FL=1